MDPAYVQEYEQFELNHWWFVARRQFVCELLDRYAHGSPDPAWLDVGCGTGVLLAAYARIRNKLGLEVEPASVAGARAKGLNVVQIDRDWDLQRYGRFDVITLCDVIEHLQDDRAAIDSAHAALAPGAVVLVTVPALRSLWSDHDVVNHHFRRYSMPELVKLFDPVQWDVCYRSYFSSLLLPLIWGTRQLNNLKKRIRPARPRHDLSWGPAWMDRALLAVFRTEVRVLRRTRMPLGSSIALVARKRHAATAEAVAANRPAALAP